MTATRPPYQLEPALPMPARSARRSWRRKPRDPGNVGQNGGSEAAMTVKLFAFTCGTVTGEFAHLMEGGEGDITVPIPVFLIEHPKGRALFDTGLQRGIEKI